MRKVSGVLRLWDKGCVGCRANQADDVERHRIEVCLERNEEDISQATLFTRMTEQLEKCEAPRCEQGGRCWVGRLRCKKESVADGGRGECRWSRLARTVVCGLLSSRQRERVTEWLVARGFRGSDGGEKEQWQALAGFLAQSERCGDVESNVMCKLIGELG